MRALLWPFFRSFLRLRFLRPLLYWTWYVKCWRHLFSFRINLSILGRNSYLTCLFVYRNLWIRFSLFIDFTTLILLSCHRTDQFIKFSFSILLISWIFIPFIFFIGFVSLLLKIFGSIFALNRYWLCTSIELIIFDNLLIFILESFIVWNSLSSWIITLILRIRNRIILLFSAWYFVTSFCFRFIVVILCLIQRFWLFWYIRRFLSVEQFITLFKTSNGDIGTIFMIRLYFFNISINRFIGSASLLFNQHPGTHWSNLFAWTSKMN